MNQLTIRQLQASYGKQTALSIPELTLDGGQLVALAGPNGAGKSTLLKSLAAVVTASGEILLDGNPVAALSLRQRAKQIGYLPQGREVHWAMTVRDVVALGRLPHQDGFTQSAEDVAAIDEAMQITETTAFAERSSQSLSGGELARVLLARALAVQSPVLLCDEPTASLDPYHQHAIMQTLRDIAATGKLVIVVLHDLNLAMQYCDQVVLLNQGQLVAHGNPQTVLTAAQIQQVFAVDSHTGHHAGSPYLLTVSPRP